MSASIQVAIKVRPLIKREVDENLPIQWSVQDKFITPLDVEVKKRGDGGFQFDHIFDMETTTKDIFETVAKPVVDAAVNGFNGTIFAYGQTSSGKTYAMMGTSDEPGVVPLSVVHIFDSIQNSDRQFLLRVSYIEIYNERVNDLLDADGTDLKIKDDARGQAFVHCKEELVNSPERILAIMKKGDKNRRIGETNMNERSSRSHTILRITIESREANADDTGAIQVSQLNLVDLAGSERAGQTGAIGTRFKEGTHINMSLSALGLVIMQLSESQDNPKMFVNFRDSKLTRILQPSLGGNAMTTIICAVTPAALEETQCTLAFASRAKRIKNKPKLNEELSEAALLKRYAKHISRLETELKKVKSADVVEMESKLLEKERANQILEERIELLKNSILCGNSASGKEDSFKSEAKRRRTWGGSGTLSSKNSILQNAIGLPTIVESDRTPEKKEQFKQHSKERQSIIQKIDIANETFQTAFTDFEIELIECERAHVGDRLSDVSSSSDDDNFITRRTVKFSDDVSALSSNRRSLDATFEPKSPRQYCDERALPETPKAALRKKISVLMEQYNSLSEENGNLMEFTRLERQMIVDEEVEKAMAEHNEKLAASEQMFCELNDKYTKLQIHSAETDRLLAGSNDRLLRLERHMAESINSLRDLRREKQALVDELNKYKGENQASERTPDNKEDKEISVFENASYFEETNVSDVQTDSAFSNDTQNTQDLATYEINVANITANTTVTSDVREVKFLAEQLKETVQLLTVENTEMMNKLTNEKERANKNERHLQDTISELLSKIHAITEEKNLLKNTVWELEHRLQKSETNGSTNINEDESARSIENYKTTIASLSLENIELSSHLMNKIEEFDRVRDLKSEQDDRDCAYDEPSVNLLERNKLLENENIQLSNNLMEKIEEYDRLREDFEALTRRLTSLPSRENSDNSAEISIHLSNSIQKEESKSPSAEFVDDILQLSGVETELICDTNKTDHGVDEPTMEKIERFNGSEIDARTIDELLQISIIPNGDTRENSSNDNSSSQSDSSWKIKAELLAAQVIHLRRLNEKLKDFKHTSCKQCSYLADLNENRKILKAEAKEMNRKLVKLQEKFDRECADSEILRTKANEDLNLTMCDSTMNESSMLEGSFSVSVLEDRVQRLRLELDTLKDKYGKLSEDYNEKCDEIEKLQDVGSRETTPTPSSTESPRVKSKDKKYVKLETDLDNLKTDLRRLKKGMTAVSADLQKFSNEKAIMSNEIESLKAEKLELREKLEKFNETEDSSIARERIETLEKELDRLRKETEILNAVKEDLENAKASLEAEVRALRNENSFVEKFQEIGDSSIAEERIKTLENEVSRLSEEIDASNAVNEELRNTKTALETEVCSLKMTNESLEAMIADIKNTSNEPDRIVSLENDLARLNEEIEISNSSKEQLERVKSSLEAEIRSSKAATESMEEKLRRTELEVARLNEQIEISKIAERELENAKSLLDTEIRSLRAGNESLEKNLENKEIELVRLNEKIDTSNIAWGELEAAKSSLEAEVRALRATKEMLESRLEKIDEPLLEEKIFSSEAEPNDAKSQFKHLTESPNELVTENASLKRKLTEFEESEKEPTNSKLLLNNEATSLRTEITRLETTLGVLNERLRELEEKNDSLTSELESVKLKKIENTGGEFSEVSPYETLEEYETLVEKLRHKVEAITNDLHVNARETLELNDQMAKLSAAKEEFNDARLALESEVTKLKSERVDAEETLIALRKSLKELEDKNAFLSAELETMRTEKNTIIASAKDTCEPAEKTDLLRREKSIDALNTMVRELTIEIDRYVAENTELNTKVSVLEKALKNNQHNFTEVNSIVIVEKLREEVTLARDCITKEIKSMKPKSDHKDLNEKSVGELIGVFLHELMSKEKEIIRMLTSGFEEKKRKLEETARQSVDAEKRANVWAKELEKEFERTQQDLYRREARNVELNNEITRLKNHLMETSHENQMLKEKMNVLEMDFNTLQADLEKSREFESRSGTKKNTTLNTTQQEKERLIEDTLATREMELSSKLRLAEKQYREKVEELTNGIESYKTRNIELTNNLEGFEINEKQLRNIVDMKSSELAKYKNTIDRIQSELEQLNEKHSSLSRVCDEKSRKLEEITLLLKNKCDKLSEYKTKLETITPEYEVLRDQAIERNARMEKYKSEIDCVTRENERLTSSLRDKFVSDETKSANYEKQLADLTSTNNDLRTELDELRNVVETKSRELVKCADTIERMQSELAKLTEMDNSLCRDLEEKSRRVDEMTIQLKSKSDKLTEYEKKYETMTAEYETLRDQANERKLRLEKYKSEIEIITMENDKRTASLSDRLDSEEIKSAVYRKQLVDLTNRNTALQMELDGLRTKCDELEHANGKLTKSLRNSTSKIRAEEEMEDLRDGNRTLQRNLDGAANRIAELQEMRTQTTKELAELRGIYEIVCNENTEMKNKIAAHRSSVNDTMELRGKYELLLREKNRLALELEEKKSSLVILERKLESRERENEELKSANKELDEEMEDMVEKIHELTRENAELDEKLYAMNNRRSSDEKRETGEKRETDENESEIEKLNCNLDRLRGELATALRTSEFLKIENKELRMKFGCSDRVEPVSCDSSRSGSPALEQEAARIDNRRRRSRTELFNQKRQLDVFVDDGKFPWGEGCRCVAMEKKVRELEHELVSKNGEVAALEIRIQSENFPYIKKAKDLEELLGSSKRRIKILEGELLKLRELKNIEISSECNRCKQWEANKRDQFSQCMPESSKIRMHGTSKGISEEHIKLEKLEKIIDTLKTLCRTRQRTILELEKKNKELERRVKESDVNSNQINLHKDDKSELSTPFSRSTNSRLDSGRAMKENLPMAQDAQKPATHLRRNWFNV